MMDLSQSIKKKWYDLNPYLGDRIYFMEMESMVKMDGIWA